MSAHKINGHVHEMSIKIKGIFFRMESVWW